MKFNKNEFKWFIVLIMLTLYIYRILHTGNITLYIHPRLIKYVHVSLIALIILTLFQFKKIFITTEKNRKIYLSVFLFPLVLGFYINPQGLSGEVVANKGLSFMDSLSANLSSIKDKNSIYLMPQNASNNNTIISNSQKSQSDINAATTNKLQNKNDTNRLIVDTNNFTNISDDMCYNDPDKYKGKTIEITGFIYRDETIAKNEFVVARLMIICCTADAEVTGVLCDWTNSPSLQNDQWVKVTGKIDTEKHKFVGEEKTIDVVRVENVVSIDKPVNQYIYPE